MSGPLGASRLDGVLLDVDDTLVDTRAAFEEALAEVARAYLPDLPAERPADVLEAWRADRSGWYRRYTRGEVGYVEQRRARANELHELFGGPPLDDEGFVAWNGVFEAAFAGAWRAHDDARRCDRGAGGRGAARSGRSPTPGSTTRPTSSPAPGWGGSPCWSAWTRSASASRPPRCSSRRAGDWGPCPSGRRTWATSWTSTRSASARVGLVGVWLDRPGLRRHPIAEAEIAAARAEGVLIIGSSLAEVPALADGGERPDRCGASLLAVRCAAYRLQAFAPGSGVDVTPTVTPEVPG